MGLPISSLRPSFSTCSLVNFHPTPDPHPHSSPPNSRIKLISNLVNAFLLGLPVYDQLLSYPCEYPHIRISPSKLFIRMISNWSDAFIMGHPLHSHPFLFPNILTHLSLDTSQSLIKGLPRYDQMLGIRHWISSPCSPTSFCTFF